MVLGTFSERSSLAARGLPVAGSGYDIEPCQAGTRPKTRLLYEAHMKPCRRVAKHVPIGNTYLSMSLHYLKATEVTTSEIGLIWNDCSR